jgi:hypothetical protein
MTNDELRVEAEKLPGLLEQAKAALARLEGEVATLLAIAATTSDNQTRFPAVVDEVGAIVQAMARTLSRFIPATPPAVKEVSTESEEVKEPTVPKTKGTKAKPKTK